MEIRDTLWCRDIQTSKGKGLSCPPLAFFSVNILNSHPYFTLMQVRASECLNITQSFLFTARHLCAPNWHLKVNSQPAAETGAKPKTGGKPAAPQLTQGYPTSASGHYLHRGQLQHQAETHTHDWVPFAQTSWLPLYKYTGFLRIWRIQVSPQSWDLSVTDPATAEDLNTKF